MKNFFAYEKSVEMYKQVKNLKFKYQIKDQLIRAASSVSLNLAEGSGRSTRREQRRFYEIAYGSLLEVQAVMQLEEVDDTKILDNLNFLSIIISRLIKSRE